MLKTTNEIAADLGIDASLYPRTWTTSYGYSNTCDLETAVRNARYNLCTAAAAAFRALAYNMQIFAKPTTLKLKDKGRGCIVLTLRNGVVVGAMGSEPKRYMGLTEKRARHLARYGA